MKEINRYKKKFNEKEKRASEEEGKWNEGQLSLQ